MIPSQASSMKALPSSEMKSRSPRVVSKPRTPCRGFPPGEYHSHTDMATRASNMKTKNAAVGHVHAIHERPVVPSTFFSSLDAPERESFRNVVAHEIDYERSRHDRKDTSSSKQPKFIS